MTPQDEALIARWDKWIKYYEEKANAVEAEDPPAAKLYRGSAHLLFGAKISLGTGAETAAYLTAKYLNESLRDPEDSPFGTICRS